MLGSGGMGVVYEAVQLRTNRPVALKVIRPGLASRALLRRFEHEVWVLGQLEHPCIAQIFEADTFTTPLGIQPFFAMELVRGKPLVAGADAKGLSTTQRLSLLAQICDGVHHAHQKGVIHRDLKPGNILLSDAGVPKILDFGVARLSDADSGLATLETQPGQLVGTVPYMSPEQVLGDSRQLDIRTDVYSLGVIAYELLSGRLPHEVRECSIPEAVRRVREELPRTLGSIHASLRGEVETIVGKALAKEREHRYQSAAEFAADLRRFLANEPIIARPATTLYQMRKFAQRHRTTVASLAALAVCVLVGFAVTLAMYLKAERARAQEQTARKEAEEQREAANVSQRRAEAATDDALAIKTFLIQDLLARNQPERAGYTVTLAQAVERGAERIDVRFANRPLVASQLHSHVSEVFRQLGRIREAQKHADRAAQLASDAGAAGVQRRIEAGLARADLMADLGRWDEALEVLGKVQPEAVSKFGADSQLAIIASAALGDAMQVLGRHDEAQPLLRDTWDRARRTLPAGAAMVKPLNALNASLRAQGKEDITLRKEEFELLRDSLGPQDALTLVALNNYAIALGSAGKVQEGAQAIQAVLDGFKGRLPDDHAIFGELHSSCAALLSRVGKGAEAIELYRKAIEILGPARGEADPSTQRARRGLVRALSRAYQFDETRAAMDANVAARVQAGDSADSPDILQLWAEIAWVAAEAGEKSDRVHELLVLAKAEPPRPLRSDDGVSLLAGQTRAWLALHAGDLKSARAQMDEVGAFLADAPQSMRGIVAWMRSAAARLGRRAAEIEVGAGAKPVPDPGP